jgi:cytochrome b561
MALHNVTLLLLKLMNHQSTPLYDPLSRALHWLTALAVSIAFVLGPEHFGRLMHNGIDPATLSDVVWHETLGILVFVLTLVRLLWVAFRPAVPQVPMADLQQWIAKLVHLGLWALLLATPISAIMALGSAAHPLTLLGGLRVDQMPWIANSAIAKLTHWGNLHGLLGDAIMWLAGLHAAAAIFHHVILKDGVLLTMLPLKALR